jgi:DNA-binding transcriptional ArsR family regulator
LDKAFKALADPTRRQILRMLQASDLSAGEIGSKFNITAPSISHHLSILKEAGLVTAERHGQHIVYSLNMTVMQDVWAWFLQFRQTREEVDHED